jgi:hypothetical protein
MSNVAREVKDGKAKYDFVCEGCKSAGRLGVPIDLVGKTFGCPEGCGATYVLFKNLEGAWELMCVVCPIFEDEEL